MEWFTSAARAGNPTAMYNLGLCLENGLGTKADPEAALSWYRKAAELGKPEAKQKLEQIRP